jgi:hypothetical protein
MNTFRIKDHLIEEEINDIELALFDAIKQIQVSISKRGNR